MVVDTLKSLIREGLVRIVAHPKVMQEDGSPAQAVVPTEKGFCKSHGGFHDVRQHKARAMRYGWNENQATGEGK